MADSITVSKLQQSPRHGRGRPAGTGIDDADRLARIRALLTVDPMMKPTTAIRATGITDPSAIRRLREKLKASSLPESSGSKGKPSPAPRALACPAIRNDKEFKRSEAPGAAAAARAVSPSSSPLHNDAVVACLDSIIRAMTAAFEAQQALGALMFTNPAVRTALNQYIATSQMALSFAPVPAFYRRFT